MLILPGGWLQRMEQDLPLEHRSDGIQALFLPFNFGPIMLKCVQMFFFFSDQTPNGITRPPWQCKFPWWHDMPPISIYASDSHQYSVMFYFIHICNFSIIIFFASLDWYWTHLWILITFITLLLSFFFSQVSYSLQKAFIKCGWMPRDKKNKNKNKIKLKIRNSK